MAAKDGGKPELKDGYTKIASTILENLAALRLSGREWNVLMVILRQTYGWNRKEAAITAKDFTDFTGMLTTDAYSSLRSLKDKKIITTKRRGAVTFYGFQKYPGQWDSALRTKPHRAAGPVSENAHSDTPPVSENAHTASERKRSQEVSENAHSDRAKTLTPLQSNKDMKDMKDMGTRKARSASAPPGVHDLFQTYSTEYLKTHKREPEINYGKDGANLKRLLSRHTPEEMARWLMAYVNDDDPFHRRKGWDLGTFVSDINAVIESCNGPDSAEPPPGESEACKQTRAYLREQEKYGKPKTRPDTPAES